MNFWQRLSLAMRVAFYGQKAIATMLPTWENNTPSYSEIKFEAMVKHGWRRNELIFACINKTANTAASVHLEVKSRGTDKPLPDHPLAKLLARPNPFMTEFDFWAAVIIFQKLAGRAYFEKERSRGGQVVALWPLRPDWVSPIRSSANMIGGYIYQVPGLPPVTLPPEDVLDFKLFDPLNMYQGWPPTAVAGRVGDVDNAATDHLKLFFEKGGMPAGLLKTKQKLNDTAIADIRRRWGERYGGHEHWLEPAVLDSDAEYQQVALSFKDMGFDVLDSRSEARICMVLDVPAILVGAKIGLDRATYSNYGEARQAWWEDALTPLYQHYDDEINNDLVPEYGEDIYTEWNFDNVAALQEERNSRWARATAAWTAGAITLNQFCEEAGLETVGKDGERYAGAGAQAEGDTAGKSASATILGYHIEQGVVNRNEARESLGLPVEDETESRLLRDLTAKLAVAQMAINAQIPPNQAFELVGLKVEIEEPEPPAEMEPAEEEMPEDEEMEEEEMMGGKARKADGRPPDEEMRRRYEKKMERIMRPYLEGQLRRIEKEMSEQVKVHANGTATV